MNPHVKRWATGVIAVPILFLTIAYGSETIFTLLIIIATLVGVMEYNRMVFGTGLSREKVETLAVALLILIAAAARDRVLLVAVLSFAVMAILMLNLLRIREEGLDMMPCRQGDPGCDVCSAVDVPFHPDPSGV